MPPKIQPQFFVPITTKTSTPTTIKGREDATFAEGFIKQLGETLTKPRFESVDFLKPISKVEGGKPVLNTRKVSVLDLAGIFPGGTVTKAPKVAEKIFDAGEYVAEQVAKRVAAQDKPGVVQKVQGFLGKIKKKIVEMNAPIEDVLATTLRKNNLTLKPTEDITNAIDRVYRAPTIAGQFVKDHGLEGIIKGVDDLDAFDQYLIARQAQDVATRGFATGRDAASDTKLVSVLGTKYEKIAEGVTDYSRRLLDYSVDSGLISPDLAKKLKVTYPNYVPLNRVFTELEREGSSFATPRGIASLSSQGVVRALQGSTREIESPIESLLSRTYDTFLQGERNKTAKMLVGYKDLPDNPFQLREVKTVGEASKNMGTISYLDDGVKRVYETTKDIEAAAKALNPQTMNIVGRILAFPTRLARIGITGINIPFVAANLARDQVTALINSRKGLQTSLANPSVYMAALFNAIGHGKLYNEIVRAGGMGTSFDIARDQIPRTIKSIRSQKDAPSRIAHLATNPAELFRAVEDIVSRAEEFTRIKQYAGTKDALLKQGMSPEDAIAGAARAAREDTVNFLRRGEWGTVLNSALLYMNAGIQGTRTLLRALKERPVATATKIAVSTFTPVAIAAAWNISDPKRKEAYDDIADYEKENNLIIIPPNPTKDEDGRWNVIKIPLSPEISSIANVPRRAVETAYGLDPLRAGEVFAALLGSVQPIDPTPRGVVSALTPQAIKPPLEAVVNQNFFTGLPIVPRSMEDLPPELQAKDNTSGAARALGAVSGTSPLKIEAFVKGTLGGVGSQVINAVDTALAAGGVIPSEQIGGESILEGLTRRIGKATGGEVERKAVEKVRAAISEQEVEKFQLSQRAEAKYKELKSLAEQNREAANEQYAQLSANDKTLAEEIRDIAEKEKLGYTASDRFMLQLNVTNGARAKFIFSLLEEMKTKEEKNAYVQRLIDNKVISTNVYNQLAELIRRK